MYDGIPCTAPGTGGCDYPTKSWQYAAKGTILAILSIGLTLFLLWGCYGICKWDNGVKAKKVLKVGIVIMFFGGWIGVSLAGAVIATV